MAVVDRPLTDADLRHPNSLGPGYDSTSMRRMLPVPGADLLPGGLSAHDAFAIDSNGTPLDLGGEGFADGNAEQMGDDPPDGQMDVNDLKALLEQEEADAVDFQSAGIAQERADALDYYFGRPFGNEEDNESQAISTDVFDVVETMLPAIIKPFISSDDVVEFLPEGEHDGEACEQETACVRNVLMEQNPGFTIIRNWIWDGLAQKNGVVKYFWDKTRPTRIERYTAITADVLTLLLFDGTSEIIHGPGTREYPDPSASGDPAQFMGGLWGPPMLYDVVLRIKDADKGKATVLNLPPEEFLICRDATDSNPKKARFCEHRRLMTISDLREMGYEIDDDVSRGDVGDLTGTPEFISRHQDDELVMPGDHGEGANRTVLYREMYYRVDFDGDGVAELRKICMVGREILTWADTGEDANDEVEEAPFCGWTPYIIPHKYFGVCPADMAMDTQLQKSTLKRGMLNNVYGINNNRMAIGNRVNADDVMNNVVNGFIRVNGEQINNDLLPLAPQSIIGDLLPAIQYIDTEKENRQGYSRFNKGQDANGITKAATATEVVATTDASQEREQLIARTFAECGLKDLFISLHGLIRRHGNAPETFKMLNEWVTVDPRNWRRRDRMSVKVGLGTGNKAAEIAFLNSMVPLMQQGQAMGLVTTEHLYNVGKELWQKGGYKDVSKFMRDPSAIDPATGQPFQAPAPKEDPAVLMQREANAGLVQVEEVKKQGILEKAKLDNASREKIAGVKGSIDVSGQRQDGALKGAELQLKAEDQQHQHAMEIRDLLGRLEQLFGAMQQPQQAQQQPARRPH